MIGGFILFIAAGCMQIYLNGTKLAFSSNAKGHNRDKSLEFTTAAFTIVTAFVFLMDAAFAYIDDYEY
jgi:hypothetical protein